MSFFKAPVSYRLTFEDEETRKTIEPLGGKKGAPPLLLFKGTDAVKAKLHVELAPNKTVQHQGLTAELVGQIDLLYDRSSSYEFTSLVKELEPASTFNNSQTYELDFTTLEKQFESYNGINIRLRYTIRVCMKRQYAPNITKDFDFWVHNSSNEPEINNSIKMEVGIEDCLHIEFEYNKSKYHLKDVVIGKVFFLLVRIKIKHMEVAIIRRESTGSGPNLFTESETITKFEVMDGAPVRGESIPVRLFLGSYDLTPTFRNVHSKFSVKYYLNLVLVDEEGRRYFKQQEITIYRQEEVLDHMAEKPVGKALE